MKTMIAVLTIMATSVVTAQQTNTLQTYQQAFQQQQQAILLQYGKALDTALTTLKKQGDLDSVLELQSEQKRFGTEKTVPSPTHAKGSFRPASEEHYKAMVTLLKKYVKALNQVIKNETAADRIEEAKIVRAEKDKAEFMLADIQTCLSETTPANPDSKTPSALNARTVNTASRLPVPSDANPSPSYDLVADWSETANPNGCWTYLLQGEPAKSGVRGADPFTPPGPPQIWGANGGFAGWSKSQGTEAAGLDLKAGDVYAHTLGPTGVAFRWTSPLSGAIDVTGGVWALRDTGRSTEWHIRLNGKTVSSGVVNGHTQTRSHPDQINLHHFVKVGDVIEFCVADHKGANDYVGVNLKITPRNRSPVVR